MIQYGRQDITEEDINCVVDVLKSEYLTQGPVVPMFEKAVAEYCGVGNAVAVNSATSALHLACLSLGLGPGDQLWTTPITFVASANCARYCGAKVDFIDIDPSTYNISVEALEDKLLYANKRGLLPKIIVPVHMCGQPADMEKIYDLSKKYGFKIIEDASHAIGARYKDSRVGSCKYSDITVFSFHPVKIITTGEGGMALTNSLELAKKMHILRSHGITRDPELMTLAQEGPWHYQQIELGFNYRMTDIQAALGISQMHRIEDYVSKRQLLASHYQRLLKGLQIQLPLIQLKSQSSWHLYVIRVPSSVRTSLYKLMQKAGMGVNVHYTPVHLQPYYQRLGFMLGQYPNAEAYGAQAITLPLHPSLTLLDINLICQNLRAAIQSIECQKQ